MSKLVISGIAHDLAEDFITIGRGRDNTIIINHPSVSTRHAQLQRTGEICRLKDFNSTNGTRVNGIPVTESILRAGDLIQFGAAEARYESPDVAASRPSPPLEPVEIKADELGLVSFPKTSGATGLHILAPIRPELAFPHVRDFARALAREVERRIGDQSVATTTWKVADRVGVFVDYGQNARDRTIASAYSIRPTPDARASAPMTWDEVPRSDPAKFTLQTMRKRIDKVGDLTAGMWRRKVSLRGKFEQLGLKPPT